MDNWLRPSFLRKNTTPAIPSSPNFERKDRPASFRSEGAHGYDGEDGRIRASSRASSFFGGFITSSPAESVAPPEEEWPNISRADVVWDSPSSDQMAEMLKVAMMTQSTMVPLPIRYNSCILHVIEEYWVMNERAKRDQAKIEKLERNQKRDIEEVEILAAAWEQKERDYKAEIKRLEVLLSKTQGGMATVSMARTNSVVHGSKRASEIIWESIGTIRERNDIDMNKVTLEDVRHNRQLNDERYKEPYQRTEKNSSPLLAPIGNPSVSSPNKAERILGMELPRIEPQFSLIVEPLLQNDITPKKEHSPLRDYTVISEHQPYISREQQMNDYQNRQSARESRNRGNSLGSTSNSTSSGVPDYSSDETDSLPNNSQSGVGPGLVTAGTTDPIKKLVPSMPTRSTPDMQESETLQRYLGEDDDAPLRNPPPLSYHQISFSFNPTDSEILSRAPDELMTPVVSSLKKTGKPVVAVSPVSSPSHTPTEPSNKGRFTEKDLRSSGQPEPERPNNMVHRGDSSTSNSSVVTAVRHNSARSSISGSVGGLPVLNPQNCSVRGQRPAHRGGGRGSSGNRENSGEAMTAANRAVAASARKQHEAEKPRHNSGSHESIEEKNCKQSNV
ncbi:hypothetical protein BJ878DRAFT_538903 [Calycina marina]|uniref:Uncharacterized protein n=1 Tax=Calycina marina TaxID=1763456 RepID=A0A9P7ZA80_9HELO|nr:hypothetical protein BJ878DRAFT_538903 [Calycina marina]